MAGSRWRVHPINVVVTRLVRPDGGRGTIKVKRSPPVGQLKAKLLSSSPLLHKGCRLALFGVELDDDEATVGSLALVQGDCVHSCFPFWTNVCRAPRRPRQPPFRQRLRRRETAREERVTGKRWVQNVTERERV